MRIALASDHAGYAEKERLKGLLTELGVEFQDLGTVSEESVDYPDYARKVAEQVFRQGDGELGARGLGPGHPQVVEQVTHLAAASGKHDLDRVLGQGVLERALLRQEGAIGLEERPVPRVLPVDPFEDDLTLAGPVEHQRGTGAVCRSAAQDVPCGPAREEMAHCGGAAGVLDDGAVAENEGQRTRQRLEDRPGELIAPSGGERDFDTGVDRPADGGVVRLREPAMTVEERAVDIEREQTDHQFGDVRPARWRRSDPDCTGWRGIRRWDGENGVHNPFLVSSVDSRSELHSHLPDDLTLEDVAEDVLLHILVGKVGYLQ